MKHKESWNSFKDSGMLWWINRIIHTFGWSIVLEMDQSGNVKEAFPARTNYLGFPQEIDEERFNQFKNHIKEANGTTKEI